ncbi:cell filamentation protein Fic [bacterium C-53]|nr:cell filamentation protein Fic [Lachnospiraceae bacterium]NBI04949.1 cell filamentation protein Fic [Lachnospiraceae bacterium]RKJ07563.1 cell filamentation protein Fic [bacterium C-53]
MDKKIQIRNSTTDFLVFTKQNGEDGIEVRVHDEDVWLTQKSMARLFDCSTDNIGLHLKNIFASGELEAEAVTEESSATASDGKKYRMKFYNLDAIISVGYRINSIRATQFRQWATKVLKTFAIQGYVLDKKRLENGQIFDEEYFEHLLDEIREIRASERKFYQKITDIYATAVDYSPIAATSKDFFAMVQNKLHYAIHHHTASEVIVERADHRKEHMGLTTWKNAPMGKIVKSDVSIAKNYLTKVEMQDLNQFVTMYLDYAERQARRQIPMTMEDWAKRLDVFLEFNEEEILRDKGKVSAEIAKSFAESEFEKYRVIQDGLYQSDFDKLLFGIGESEKENSKTT